MIASLVSITTCLECPQVHRPQLFPVGSAGILAGWEPKGLDWWDLLTPGAIPYSICSYNLDNTNRIFLPKVRLYQVYNDPIYLDMCSIFIYFFRGKIKLKEVPYCLPAMQETQVQSLGWEDPLEKEMATHSSILAWEIPWSGAWQVTVHGVTKELDMS